MIFWHLCFLQEIHQHFFRRLAHKVNQILKVELLSRRKFLLDIENQANLTSIAFTSDAPAVHSVNFAKPLSFFFCTKVQQHSFG